MQTGLGGTFDTVSQQYEALRPGYPDDLYQTLFREVPLSPQSRALEIGIGGGQATEPVLRTGCAVLAVEPGAHFVELCRAKFRDYPSFSVWNATFEEAELPDSSFDLIYSATAFHWVPPGVGYPKVYSLLKPGGVFARFANRPCPCLDNEPLAQALDRAYEAYYYAYYQNRTPKKRHIFSEKEALALVKQAERWGFVGNRFALFHRMRTFSAESYLELLGTYSDHIALPETLRTPFYEAIREAIHAHGGTIHVFDIIDLELSRKPGPSVPGDPTF